MASLLVSGAGTTAVNQVFNPIAPHGGQPAWQSVDTTYFIYFAGAFGYWLSTTENDTEPPVALYFANTPGDVFGLWSTNSGVNPAPTVTALASTNTNLGLLRTG